MKKNEIIATLLSVFVVMPLWFLLLYRILQAVKASELDWFLYWAYVPMSLLVFGMARAFKGEEE